MMTQRDDLKPNFRGEPILAEPLYGYSGEGHAPYRPTVREVFVDWIDSVSVIKNPSRLHATLNLAYRFLTFTLLLAFIFHYFSLGNCLFVTVMSVLSVLYTTQYGNIVIAFTQPLYLESSITHGYSYGLIPLYSRMKFFAIPHRIHHMRSDKSGGPCAPDPGRLGS